MHSVFNSCIMGPVTTHYITLFKCISTVVFGNFLGSLKMRSLLVVLLLVVSCAFQCDSALNRSTPDEDSVINSYLITTLLRLINTTCPSSIKPRLVQEDPSMHILSQKSTYHKLFQQFIKCKKEAASKTTTTPETLEIPRQCRVASNRTDSWRNFDKGKYTKIRKHCDIDETSTEWFRFSGAAGNRMLNKCPKTSGCGVEISYWTDEKMPKVVGLIAEVIVYGQKGTNCAYKTKRIRVTKCSQKANDYIYRQLSEKTNTTCSEAFCGMD